ncbi:MAG: YcxB family protein [Acholeplasmataceae bacterium]|nr:YcxB family protein [Acholeplasmataceae bacterium]
MEYTITSQIEAKDRFFDLIIRSYLHRPIMAFLYFGSKIFAIYNLTTKSYSIPMLYFVNILLFIYFDIFIVFSYFRIKKQLSAYYGDERTQTLFLEQDTIEMKSKNTHHTLKWNDITRVKETTWYFFIYKEKLVIGHIFKWFINKEDYNKLITYFDQQAQLGRNIMLRKHKK